MVSRDIKFRFLGDSRQLQKASKDAASAMSPVSKAADTARNKFDLLRAGIQLALGAAAVKVVANFAGAAINAASSLEESVNAVEVVFGDAADIVLDFGKDAADAVGLANSEFNQLATTTGSLLTNFGFGAREAAEETINLTERAADMASVFDTDVADALGAIEAALRGESEPIRRFGVSLTDAAVRAKAVELGLAATTAEVDEHGKAVGRLALIYEQTDKVAGDFQNTSGSLANVQRRLDAELENVKATIGGALIPAATDLLVVFGDLLESDPFKFLLRTVTDFTINARIGILKVKDNLDDLSLGLIDLAEKFGFGVDEGFLISFLSSLRNISREVDAGTVPALEGAARAFVFLGREGKLSESALREIQVQLGLTDDDMITVTKDVIKFAEENGVTADAVAFLSARIQDQTAAARNHSDGLEELNRETDRTASATDNLTERNRAAAEALLVLAEHTRNMETINDRTGRRVLDHADAVGTLDQRLIAAAGSQTELANVMQEAVNPLFRAKRAADRYAEKLREIDEDGERTAEELFELAEEKAALDVAFSDLQSLEEINTAVDGFARLLGISRDRAREVLVEMGVLDGETFRAAFVLDVKVIGDKIPTSSGPLTIGGSQETSGGTVFFGHDGGVVPGPRGQEVAAVLQAGERIISLQEQRNIRNTNPITGGGGGALHFNFQGAVLGSDQLVRDIQEKLVVASRAGRRVS